MASFCLNRTWPAHASSSWLASLPSCCCCCSLSTNQQIVPRLRVSHSTSSVTHITHETIYLQAAAAAPRAARIPAPAAAVVAAAAAPSATAHSGSFTAVDADDPSTTRARLYALYEFVSVNHRLPDIQEQYQGVAIGQWTEKCRQQQQQEGLEPDLAAALQTIPGWSWESHIAVLSDSFQDNLQQLAAYAQQYGPPPQRSSKKPPRVTSKKQEVPSEAERDAAVAISKQIVDQRKRGVFTQQQMEAVPQAVPGWKWHIRIRTPPLDEIIRLLQEFHRQHQRLPKSHERLEDGFLIGEWCMSRRGEYSRGELEGDVAAALETQVPDWLWNRLDNFFERSLEVLAAFVERHGRTPTQREEFEGVRVGAWCNKIRLKYKAGGLAADRVAALEAIPGWWWSSDRMPDNA